MTRPRNVGRAAALVVLAATFAALSLTGSDIDATGWAPNVRPGHLRAPATGLYLCDRHGILKSTDHGKTYRVVLRPPAGR